MDCLTCRESLSAGFDSEPGVAPADQVGAHLAGCGACRAWQRRGEELNRALRVRPAVPVPDLSPAILADAPVIEPPEGWWLRGVLLCVAIAQVTLGLSQLVGMGATAMHLGHDDGPSAAGHLFNESTAWNLALGMGMFWAAFRPRATTGLVPVLAGFVVVLFAYSAHDLFVGAAPVSRVLGHSLLVIGLGLLIAVNRRHRPPAPDGVRATAAAAHGTASAVADPAGEVAGPTGRPHLRPASHHRAA